MSYQVVDTETGDIVADGFSCVADAQEWIRQYPWGQWYAVEEAS
jgi:hypothetical protein